MFHFSFPGGSGKFVFNRNRDIVKYNVDDNNITDHPFLNRIDNQHTEWDLSQSQFVITDAQGITYTFAAVEETITGSNCGDPGVPNNDNDEIFNRNNWLLTRMSRSSNWIDFAYTEQYIVQEITSSETRRFAVDGPGVPISSFCNNTWRGVEQRLTTITTSNGYLVEFAADPIERNDLPGSKRLAEIIVKKDGAKLAHYRLDHDYFGNQSEDFKLRLDKVNQVSTVSYSTLLPGYEFEYYNDKLCQ